jgi:hypothetical protein
LQELKIIYWEVAATSDSEISQLKSQYDSYSLYAERIAYFILVGLIVEIVAVFLLKKPWYEAVLTISSTLFIFLGVWGKYSLRGEQRNQVTSWSLPL